MTEEFSCKKPLPLLVTHSGTFHMDDAFAYVTLCLALDLKQPELDHHLDRTRDPARIAAADIIWDVGARHNVPSARFDHHQRGAPVRMDTGVPYSAAGLVWQVHGRAAVRNLLPAVDADRAEAVATRIDREVVRRIDALDNGVAVPDDRIGLSSLVEDCNLSWTSPVYGKPEAEDDAFLQAAEMVKAFLIRRVDKICAALEAETVVAAQHKTAHDPRLLELKQKMPWQDAVMSRALPVIYAIYPIPRGNWMVDAMPVSPGSHELRLALPAVWAGLNGSALVEASGIADAIFVHPRRFIAAALSRAGAYAMANSSLSNNERISALARFAPIFSDPAFSFLTANRSQTDASGHLEMYSVDMSDTAYAFVRAAYDAGWVIELNWPDWMDTPEAKDLTSSIDRISMASEDQLAKLLTAIIRSDRFNEGELASAYASGMLTAIVRRAEALLAGQLAGP